MITAGRISERSPAARTGTAPPTMVIDDFTELYIQSASRASGSELQQVATKKPLRVMESSPGVG
jgi:hypothetical protein